MYSSTLLVSPQRNCSTELPEHIDKYRVINVLGESGQAKVYRVVHPQLHNELALKLSHQPVDQENTDPIVAEGRLLTELEHRNIVRIYDLGFWDGCPFLVLEYIRGRSLAQVVREEGIRPHKAAYLLAQIAGAVSYSHRRGVVHLDLKPENMLVSGDGTPYLIDFGVACVRGAWNRAARKLPSSGGTLSFMAPEQACGEPVGPYCDIFGLGATLYSLLTEKPPYTGASPGEVFARAKQCEFDREALARESVPAELAAICLKAMRESPRDRYRSAAEFADELEALAR